MFMWMVFVRLSLSPSSRNQKKRKYFFPKRGVFRDFIRIFALSFDTISTTNNSKPKKIVGL